MNNVPDRFVVEKGISPSGFSYRIINGDAWEGYNLRKQMEGIMEENEIAIVYAAHESKDTDDDGNYYESFSSVLFAQPLIVIDDEDVIEEETGWLL